ncbi:MAG: hypothetical protein GC159_14425 [Phycisphaera sp.]|nr:hypothetical protein [Phycisphaera sp.]
MSEQTTVEHDQDHAPAEAEVIDDATEIATDGAEAGVEGSERLVPVSESIRYRRRAQAAEQRLRALQSALDEARASLDETREQLDAAERRRRIDAMLIESEAIDLEAARLLTEAAVAEMDEADVAEAVTELKRRRPYLFRRGARAGGGTMSPRPRRGGADVADAAEAAATTGDRRELLRYLRLRRGGK